MIVEKVPATPDSELSPLAAFFFLLDLHIKLKASYSKITTAFYYIYDQSNLDKQIVQNSITL